MKAKRSRPKFFVCSAIISNNLVAEMILSPSIEEAIKLFTKQFGEKPTKIHGPFYKVKTQILENTRVLKFTDNRPRKAVYNDWIVNAFMLNEPADHAYLVFIKRIDDKKIPSPKGTITAPIHDLRFTDDK